MEYLARFIRETVFAGARRWRHSQRFKESRKRVTIRIYDLRAGDSFGRAGNSRISRQARRAVLRRQSCQRQQRIAHGFYFDVCVFQVIALLLQIGPFLERLGYRFFKRSWLDSRRRIRLIGGHNFDAYQAKAERIFGNQILQRLLLLQLRGLCHD